MRTEGQAVTAGERLQSSYNFNEIHRPPALTGHLHNYNHAAVLSVICISMSTDSFYVCFMYF